MNVVWYKAMSLSQMYFYIHLYENHAQHCQITLQSLHSLKIPLFFFFWFGYFVWCKTWTVRSYFMGVSGGIWHLSNSRFFFFSRLCQIKTEDFNEN